MLALRSPEPQSMTNEQLGAVSDVLTVIVGAGSLAAGMAVRILGETNREIQSRVVESNRQGGDKR